MILKSVALHVLHVGHRGGDLYVWELCPWNTYYSRQLGATAAILCVVSPGTIDFVKTKPLCQSGCFWNAAFAAPGVSCLVNTGTVINSSSYDCIQIETDG
jgi:hypothetical protein